MDTRVRLSIIIPMYNAEKYIAKCLDSIFAEIDKTDDIEVILIDDGSSDRSIESCKDFLVYNIQILKNIHKGVSAARNLGIAQATGKWIMFVDADDWLAQGWSSVLSAYYADSADIVFFNKDIVEKMVSCQTLHHLVLDLMRKLFLFVKNFVVLLQLVGIVRSIHIKQFRCY